MAEEEQQLPQNADDAPEVADQALDEEEEELFKMAVDEFYPENHTEKAFQDSDLSQRSMSFFQSYGQTSYKRYNFHWLGDSCFIYAAGNTYQIYDTATGSRRIFHGTDTDGIGSISIHQSRKYFAIAEKGTLPNIYIYEYPSLKLYRILRKGTDLMYAHVEFSTTGTKLASLGGAPDYTLTVWDWVNQKVVLKCKAFSQEVYRVQFSPYTDDILFTCGQGHIKFWKMAKTFTGLKLQGEIAKFGQLELSDVSALYELPDGKVVTGTQYGNLIVWEGQFVKSHLMLDDKLKIPLHNGFIEVILQDNEYFITAGGDGYVKWFRISDIDSAEAEEGLDVQITPTKEILISSTPDGKNPAHIMNMILADDVWYIQDRRGRMYVMDKETDNYKCIYEFHQGHINSLVTSPNLNYAVSTGEDGVVKVWDFVRKNVVHQQYYSGKGTCLEHLPFSDANKGRVCAAGFDNGIVRILAITADGINILKAFKAHDDAIAGIRFSKDLKMCCTASKTGDVFFFETDGNMDLQKFDPLCTVKLPENAGVNDFKWNQDDNSILFGCNNGYVFEIRRPRANEIDNKDSYQWEDPDIKTWRIKIMEFQMQKNQKKDEAEEEKKRRMRLRGELPPEENEPEEDWPPEPIRAIMPYVGQNGVKQFLVGTQGQYNGFMYLCQMDQIRPIKAIPINKNVQIDYLILQQKKGVEIIVIGYDNGEIQLIINHLYDKRMTLKYHDAHLGKITSAVFNYEENFFLTTSQDGLIFVFQFDKLAALEESKFKPLDGVEGANYLPEEERQQMIIKRNKDFRDKNPAIFQEITDEHGLDEAALAISMKLKEPINIDVTDPTIYSIQQSKLRTEEDHRLTLAEQKKERERQKIQNLRDEFQKLIQKNNVSQEHLQITQDDFQIDPEFFMILQERKDIKIEETKKEVAWDIEYATVNLNKLKNKYYDVLEFEKFTVKAIKSKGSYVTTFRVQKMSEFLQSNIESFKQMLENEIIGKDDDQDDDLMDDASKDDNQVDNEKQKEKEKAAALIAKQKAAQQAALNAKKTEAEKKREARKLEREERKRKIEKYEKQEAMHNGEDPEDRRDIEVAQATYGDFKLKVSPEYTVPENQRMNFQKKRQQMVLLEGSIHKLKVDFNQKIQELKIRKKDIVQHVLTLNQRLKEINSELGQADELFEPTIDKESEYPENYFEITDDDIKVYKTQKELEAQSKNQKGKKGAVAQKEEKAAAEAAAAAAAQQQEYGEEQNEEEREEKEEVIDVFNTNVLPRKGAKVQNTEFDIEYHQIKNIELLYEKEQKKKEIEEIILTFDEEIKEMQKEKYRLESDLKNAEMKLILFFEELILLKSMESKDQLLTRRLAECRKEKGMILKDINDISRKLKDKTKEINDIKEREDDLMARFHELCPEGTDKYDEIRKFFDKVIKRKRRVEKVEKQEGEDDEDEVEEEEEEQDEEDEDEDEDENNVTGLSPEEYKIEDIEKLREERLDLVDEKQKIQAFIEDLDTQRRKLENKEKNIKADLEETEEEIQDFQSEKMSKLNELKVSIVLKIKQIQNLEKDQAQFEKWEKIREQEINQKLEALQQKAEENGIDDQALIDKQKDQLINEEEVRGYFLPQNLDGSILFTRTQLLQLINRKRELDEEYEHLKKQFKDFKRDFNQQKKEIKENEKKRELREREYNERQMLRFGNLVDLDNLEVSGPSSNVIDLRLKFQKTEKKCFQMIEEAQSEFDKTQRELTGEMKNNTTLLNLIRSLGEQELDLDRKLNDSNKAIFVDEDDEKKRHIMEEKLKIKKLLEIQEKEIVTFKTEINMYKRKGGHIYTKVTTNRRVANLNQDNN